jgi:hypothetical protein
MNSPYPNLFTQFGILSGMMWVWMSIFILMIYDLGFMILDLGLSAQVSDRAVKIKDLRLKIYDLGLSAQVSDRAVKIKDLGFGI